MFHIATNRRISPSILQSYYSLCSIVQSYPQDRPESPTFRIMVIIRIWQCSNGGASTVIQRISTYAVCVRCTAHGVTFEIPKWVLNWTKCAVLPLRIIRSIFPVFTTFFHRIIPRLTLRTPIKLCHPLDLPMITIKPSPARPESVTTLFIVLYHVIS
jgi:hypothetical protein